MSNRRNSGTTWNEFVDDEEEDECRVCRGPAEEGRPLYKPCKCSGSIASTHQDCLTSWLAVKSNGNASKNKCDLCSYKFKFAPRYKEGTPDRLHPTEIIIGLCRRAFIKWIPFASRIAIALGLWLGVLPLCTAHIYQGWMGGLSSIKTRWRRDLLASDAVSGVIITAVIIISFLSIMSLADFFRVHWRRDGVVAGVENINDGQNEEREERNNERNNVEENDDDDDDDDEDYDDDENQSEEDEDIARIHDPDLNWNLDENSLDDNDIIKMDQHHLIAKRNVDDIIKMDQHHLIAKRNVVGVMDEGHLLLRGQNEPEINTRRASLKRAYDDEYPPDELENIDALYNKPRRRINPDDIEFDNDMDTIPLGSSLQRQREHEMLQRDLFDMLGNVNVEDINENLKKVMNDDIDDSSYQVSSSDESSKTKRTSNGQNIFNEFDFEHNNNDNEEEIERMMQMQENELNNFIDDGDHDDIPEEQQDFGLPFPNNEGMNPRFEPQFEPLQPLVDQEREDPMDMDMQVAFDEFLGLRGPISALIKNLIWLLLFISIYLAMFAYVPTEIGLALIHRISRWDFAMQCIKFFTERFFFIVDNSQNSSMNIANIIENINARSRETNCLLIPSDIATMTLGYISIASTAFSLQFMVVFFKKIKKIRSKLRRSQQPHGLDAPPQMRPIRLRFDENFQRINEPAPNVEIKALVIEKLLLALECSTAVFKVSFLMFFKMFWLPLLLGMWLDVATLDVFEREMMDRIKYAGTDIVAFVLIHWVCGITFMLIVTVSVLQLREVVHPDLLAQVIRPQEPQPDLLGNLLKDSGFVHAKKISMSLCIYAALLVLNVWLPSKMIILMKMGKYLPIFRPKFWHILTPQLQVPIELLIFHLSMLAILERYKNRIGVMQHLWMKRMSKLMNLTRQLLPQEIVEFELTGIIPKHISPLWDELLSLKKTHLIDEFIETNVVLVAKQIKTGVRTDDGERLLEPSNRFIVLSESPTKKRLNSRKRKRGICKELPCVLGSYRCTEGNDRDGNAVIEFWREVAGAPIPRPPEGWDDLHPGGAVEQGRWAWDKERKSDIEQGIARRQPFFPVVRRKGKLAKRWKMISSWIPSIILIMKIIFLLIFSWLALVLFTCASLSLPLSVGRFLYSALRIPDEYIHDPVVYPLGGFLLVSITMVLIKKLQSIAQMPHWKWYGIVKCGTRKTIILFQTFSLWFILSPIQLGAIYEFFFVKQSPSFVEDLSSLYDFRSLLIYWKIGFVLLNVWASFCYFGAFRRNFWSGLIHGENADINGENIDIHSAQNGNGIATNSKKPWQGKDGVVFQYVESLSSAVLDQEWDKIDRKKLLDDFTVPVTFGLTLLLFVPIIFYLASLKVLEISFGYALLYKVCKIYLYRIFAATWIIAQGLKYSKNSLVMWFEAAHKAARDDRYLIGEILLDYVPLTRYV